MKQTKPNAVIITEANKADLERFAREDGMQRGIFFDTSGKARMEVVSATAMHSWLFKTQAGKPKVWTQFQSSR